MKISDFKNLTKHQKNAILILIASFWSVFVMTVSIIMHNVFDFNNGVLAILIISNVIIIIGSWFAASSVSEDWDKK